MYRSYLRSFLEKTRVTMHVFRAGENKSAVEPYLRMTCPMKNERWSRAGSKGSGRHTPSSPSLEGNCRLGHWISSSHPLRLSSTLQTTIWPKPCWLRAGSICSPIMPDGRCIGRVGGVTDEDGYAEFISLDRYVEDVKMSRSLTEENLPLIAIIPVEGTLMPGESEEGMAGSDTINGYIDTALEAEDLAAIVLRVNSPGGSVFASDLIRRKLLEVAGADIPIVVSMGTVAASGGYWIAADADEIWALPTTLTGSIGAFSAFPTIEGIVEYIGVTVDGVGTTPLAGAASFNRGLSPEMASIVQALAYGAYDDFIELVASGRDMSEQAVREVADGLVGPAPKRRIAV